MEAIKLLESLNNRYITALSFHREMADSYRFMSFEGFSALHEYQYLDESLTQRKVKQWIIDNHYIATYDKIEGSENDNEFRKFADGKSRFSVTSSDKWTFLQESSSDYRNWESETLKFQQDISNQLRNEGYISDSIFVDSLILEVSKELSFWIDIYLAMQGMEFDIPTITSMQPDLKQKYITKIRKLFKQTRPGED